MSALIDLSKAARLRDVVFLCGRRAAGWATIALRTITSDHRNLRQITISVPEMTYGLALTCVDLATVRNALGEVGYRHWLELDHVLAQLWESHSIRPKVLHFVPPKDEIGPKSCVDMVLPEVTRRGIADLVVPR